MKHSVLLLLIIVIATFASEARSDKNISGHPAPLSHELLPKPIALQDCSGVIIKEWRGSRGKNYTEVNSAAIEKLNKICKASVARFHSYLNQNGIQAKQCTFTQNVSVLPWDAFDSAGSTWGPGDGDDYRNLQDIKWRFNDRYAPGESIKEVLGWTDRNINYVFIINDVLDRESHHPPVAEIFSHELFHAMSNMCGVWETLGGSVESRQVKDEELASAFGKIIRKELKL